MYDARIMLAAPPGDLAVLRQLLVQVLPTQAQLLAFCARHFADRFTEDLTALTPQCLVERLLARATAPELRYRLTVEKPDAMAHYACYPLQAELRTTSPQRLRYLPQPRDPHFSGRAEQLGALHGLLSRHRVAVLTGPAGVGKTALALEFAHRLADEQTRATPTAQLTQIAWLDGTSPETLKAGFCALSRALLAHGFPIQPLAPGDNPAHVRDFFCSRADWLLVVDNLCGAQELVQFLGSGNPAGRLLCTAAELAARSPAVLGLGPLTDGESLQLLARRSDRHNLSPQERTAVQRLARALGYMPAALCRAADRVRNDGLTWVQALAHTVEAIGDQRALL